MLFRSELARDRRMPNLVMMLASLAVMFFAFPSPADLAKQVNDGNPVGAIAFMRRTGLSGRMLNDYGYGGYLIWAAPEYKVFVDGRAELYDATGLLKEYGEWTLLQQDPKVLLEKYKIDFCLLPKSAPMARVLPYLPQWKEVFADETSVIFSRLGHRMPVE